MIRADVFYTGRVQGVGFRWRTLLVSQKHSVTGYVRNLRDGRVELVAEGEREAVDAFLDGVQDELGAYVHDADVALGDASGAFTAFEIAR